MYVKLGVNDSLHGNILATPGVGLGTSNVVRMSLEFHRGNLQVETKT